MKLLLAIPRTGRGGAERLVLQLAADAVTRGDEVGVISNGGVWMDRVAEVGAVHHLAPLERGRLLPSPSAAVAMRRVLRSTRPDIVHAHTVGVAMAARTAMLGLRRPPALLTTFHGVPPEHYAMSARALRVLAPSVIACSGAVGRSLEDAGYPAPRVTVIDNGARLDPADEGRIAAIRERYGLGDPLVIGIGRLVPQKSWSTLIAAAGRIDPAADIVVAGHGRIEEQLRAETAAAGGRVRFIGPVDDVAALIGASTCMVSTSEWEGLPLTLLEALSLGASLVTTAVDGVADVLTPEIAEHVPVGDAGAVADAVNRVLADPELAARLSRAALAAAPAWSPEAMLERYRTVYERTLAARG